MNEIAIIVAPAVLALSLFVETSSWWVRSQAPAGALGLYVSRSNIYLYGGRFFSLAFTSVAAFWIESGAKPLSIAYLLASSFLVASLVQAVLLSSPTIVSLVMRFIARCLFLPSPEIHPASRTRLRSRKLFVSTACSSFIFGFGTGMPLMAAVLVPEYRLSVSYIGQVINSLGTLIILILVDQHLFRSLDAGSLPNDVIDYGYGRVTGFGLCAISFAIIATVV